VNITQPWIGADANAGVKRSIEAKNYLRYGFINLKFGQAYNYELVSKIDELHYYQHHPPLTSLLIALSFYMFGISEISTRLVPILFTLCSIILVFTIARRCHDEHIALLSAFIFSIMPVTTFLGRTPNYEPTTQFFILLSVLLYMNWMNDRKRGRFYAFLAIYTISLFTDWPAYFLGGLQVRDMNVLQILKGLMPLYLLYMTFFLITGIILSGIVYTTADVSIIKNFGYIITTFAFSWIAGYVTPERLEASESEKRFSFFPYPVLSGNQKVLLCL